ncbi:MAG: hypothetical protein EOO47_16010, partial [Flavobacterium sp.]
KFPIDGPHDLKLAISKDERLLFRATYNGPIKIVNIDDGTLIGELIGHSDVVTSVKFDRSESRLITTSRDKSIRVWNIADRRELRKLHGYKDFVLDSALIANDRILATVGREKGVRLWDFENGENFNRFTKLEAKDFKSFVPEKDWYNFKELWRTDQVYSEDGTLLTESDLEKYIQIYSEGFTEGYKDLDNEIKETTAIFSLDNKALAKKVFKVLNINYRPFSGTWKPIMVANSKTYKKAFSRNSMHKSGFNVGRLYKAWFYVMYNPDLFLSLFTDFYQNHFIAVEEWLKESNSHDPDYKTELQDIIDENNKKNTIITDEKNVQQDDLSKIKIDEFKLNISNAGTLSREEKKSILKEIKDGTNRFYKSLSGRCNIQGLDCCIYAMLDTALDIYVFFDENKNIEIETWKSKYIETCENAYQITNEWTKQIKVQANSLFVNFGENEARQFTKAIESVFMQINDVCSYRNHNFNKNIHKPLFDKCIEDLEIEYNADSIKLRSVIQSTGKPKKNRSENVEGNQVQQTVNKNNPEELSISIEDNFIIDLTKIIASYKKFNNMLFVEMPIGDYLSMWNLNKEPKPINFLKNQLAKFIYFLEQIPEIKESEALRFGIKNYNQRKKRHNPNAKLANDIRLILK